MEFAAAALTAIASTIGEGVSAVGSAIGGATGAVGAPMNIVPAVTQTATTGSFLSSILQGSAGLVGAMGAVRAGQSQAEAYRMQAGDARIDARQEEIAGMQREDGLKRKLLASLGERDAATAASGVDLSFGTPVIARDQAMEDANRAVSMNQSETEMRRARLMARAASYQRMASEAESAGMFKGVGSLLLTAGSIGRRG